jgi:hypothetical protein
MQLREREMEGGDGPRNCLHPKNLNLRPDGPYIYLRKIHKSN